MDIKVSDIEKENINSNENFFEEENNIIFILDRSGSMYRQTDDTIGGYNSFIEEEKKKGRNTYVTTVLFDNEYELLVDHQHISEVKELTSKEYYIRGTTALLDAIGKTGYENASREYKKSDIKKMIESHSEFEFLYIGASIDSYAEASQLGLKHSNIANRSNDGDGMRKMYRSVRLAREDYLSDRKISDTWKKELEDFEE